jgi:transcriptional regulator with XRE-family HTH domain
MNDEELLAHIAEKLAELTKKSGLTQAEVARRAGQQRDAYGRYVLGKTMPPTFKLAAIARVFGVEPGDIDPVRDYSTVLMQPDKHNAFKITPSDDGDMVHLALDIDLPIEVAGNVMKLVNPYRIG